MAWEADHWGSPVLEKGARTHRRRGATPNASILLSNGQWFVLLVILGATGASAYHQPRLTLTAVVTACMAFYIVTALLKLVITLAGRNYRPPRRIRVWLGDPTPSRGPA